MAISEEDIGGVTELVWGSMLELAVEPCPVSDGDADDERLVGTVEITGAWSGTIELACPQALAREAAAVVFGVAPQEANRSQLREALAELANMTAGNLKALLPEPCELGLPAVCEASEVAGGRDRSVATTLAAFSCQGHPFLVRVTGRPNG
ncbi:MAG TPA: chemotaxis protein CheX [Candidatus Binatia bacterium]|nr:chemotaxis protein CheX [Candidatus Binatia bacterium]